MEILKCELNDFRQNLVLNINKEALLFYQDTYT